MTKNFQPFTMSLIEDIEAGNAKIDGGGAAIRNRQTGEISWAYAEYFTNTRNWNKLLAFYDIDADTIVY